MNMTPASPGTLMRTYDADGNKTTVPIVGWVHVQQNMAHPIFPMAGCTAGPGSAIYIPEDIASEVGVWVYPHKGWATYSEEKMEGWISEALGEEPGDETPAPKNAPITADGKPDTRPIQFGAKTYNTKSFWHWPTANAIFEIEGKEVYPSDARVIKIKRDEYAKLKRDGATKIDPHSGLITEEEEREEPTPEEAAGLQATATGFAPDDEEDDISGLI